MFIEFGEMNVVGFKSIRELIFDFRQEGINLIRGVNGAGKTTVFEALYFCLYGELLKDTNMSGIIPKYQDNYKGTRVMVPLQKGKYNYTIVRHLGYKGKTENYLGGDKLMIFRDGELISEELHKSDLQKAINTILGVDAKTFLNSVLFGQRMKRLVESEAKDKREIFSQFFDIDWIDTAKENAKKFRDIENQKLIKFDRDLAIIEQKKFGIEDKKEVYEDHHKEWIKNTQEQIEDLKLEIEDIDIKLKQLPNVKEPKKKHIEIDISEPQNEIRRLEQQYSKEESNIRIKTASNEAYQKGITELEQKEINTICPVCEGKLSPHKVSELQKERDDALASKRMAMTALTAELEKLTKEAAVTEKKLIALKATQIALEEKYKANELLKKVYDDELFVYNNTNLQKTHFLSQKEKITEKINILSQKEYVSLPDADFDVQLRKLDAEKTQIDKDSVRIRQEVIDYDWWIAKGFGANGLKNYIINSMLQVLNRTVRRYSLRLGLSIKFSIDLEGKTKSFNVQIFKKDGIEMDYAELSGGEKTRIDLALSFGIFDLLAETKTKFNILLLDEAFENLDEAGVFDMFEILRLKAEDTNVYLISHNEKMDTLNVNTINFVKRDNFTEIM